LHKTIKAVGADFEQFRMNRAVARLREFTNDLADYKAEGPAAGWVLREAAEALTRLIAPIMPHLAEELWHQLGHDGLAAQAPWPEIDETLLVEDEISIAVQVNGKVRATIALPRDADQQAAESRALEEPNVRRALDGKTVRKVIVVPNRIVNVVAA
jgi:leucyl-tRNA synthetase